MAKILVVDDSLFIRKILTDIIKKSGHTVVGQACDGNEALEQYVKLKPDLVIMDITMPNVTGLEGLKMIKIVDDKAKVIMCSAMGQKSIIKEAISEGALDFIIKPFQKKKVIDIINKSLKNK